MLSCTFSPAVTEEQQQECGRSNEHHHHGADHGGGRRRRRGFWIHQRQNTMELKQGFIQRAPSKVEHKPEQVKEPGTLRHSEFSGQEEICSSHSLMSANKKEGEKYLDFSFAAALEHISDASIIIWTSACRRTGAPLLADWVTAGPRRSREFEAHLTLIQNHRVAQQPEPRLNSGYGTTAGI